MASNKKRRKQVKHNNKKAHPPIGAFRHRDGDRRHREAMAKAVKDAKATKKAMELYGAVILPEEDNDEAE